MKTTITRLKNYSDKLFCFMPMFESCNLKKRLNRPILGSLSKTSKRISELLCSCKKKMHILTD